MHQLLQPHEHDLITRLVWQRVHRMGPLVGEYAIDDDDVAQEWLTQLYARLPYFDPARGTLEAFVVTLLRAIVANWWRTVAARKRRPPHDCTSLATLDETAEPANELETDAVTACDARLDLAWFRQRLPPEQRAVLRVLTERSYRAAAQRLQLPFSTFMDRLQRLRAAAYAAQLDDYLAG